MTVCGGRKKEKDDNIWLEPCQCSLIRDSLATTRISAANALQGPAATVGLGSEPKSDAIAGDTRHKALIALYALSLGRFRVAHSRLTSQPA